MSALFSTPHQELQLRTTFGSLPGAIVRGWPSSGGFYVYNAKSVVELDFLNVDYFNSIPRANDQADENAHCTKMRQLGAKWYATEEDWLKFRVTGPSPDDPVLVFGWPEDGGMWLLKTTASDASELGVGRVANARVMKERCDIIRRLGGIFFANPVDCAGLIL